MKTSQVVRGFRLLVEPDSTDTYGLRLEETNGSLGHITLAGQLAPNQLVPFLGSLRTALRESGHAPTVVGPKRRKPIPLTEAAGVRLALVIKAAEPLNRTMRRLAVIEGVSAMSDEETYYWYAKTSRRESGARALRALRILLVDNDRTGVTS